MGVGETSTVELPEARRPWEDLRQQGFFCFHALQLPMNFYHQGGTNECSATQQRDCELLPNADSDRWGDRGGEERGEQRAGEEAEQ